MRNGSRTSGAALAALTLMAFAGGCAGGGEAAAPEEAVQALAGTFCSDPTFAVSRVGSTKVLLSARSGCGAAPAEYRFVAKAPGAPDYAVVVREWSPDGDATWDVTGLPAGRHTVQVRVRPSGSAVESDATATASVSVGDVCAGPVTITAAVNGASLDLAATSTCSGAATAEYRFLVKTPGAAAYTAVGAWGKASTASYPAPTPGRYEAVVQTRAVGNLSDWEAAVAASARVEPACGSATLTATPDGWGGVDLVATAACGGQTPELRYLIRGPGQASFVEYLPYGAPDRVLFKAPGAGRWEFQVWARAKYNASDWEAQATAAALVGSTCSGATLVASYDGSSLVTLEAASTCSAAPPEYRFLVRRPGATSFVEVRPWNAGATAYFPVSGPPGRYEFQVYARVLGNASAYEAVATASALVGPTCSAGTLTATWDGSNGVNLEAGATCPGTPEFRFLVKRPGAAAFAEARPYGASASLAYGVPPGAFGRYEFQAQARVAGSISDWETAATTSTLIGPTCTFAGLSATYDGSTAIRLTGSATCTAQTAEYRFLVRRPGDAAFAELRPYGTDPLAQLLMSQLVPGRWEFRVYVRGAGNASDLEATATASVFVGMSCGSASLTATLDPFGLVDLSALASCTLGGQPQYRFLVRRPGAAAFAELRPWGPEPRMQYGLGGPATPGRWEFQVQVRALGNLSDYEAAAKASVLAGATCTSASLSAALVPPGAIQAIALHASASCGVATPEFRFLARRPGEPFFSQVAGWGPSANVEIPGGAFGRYELQVQARAKGNLSDYEATASANAFYGPACSAAVLDARADAAGNVSLVAGSTCGMGAPAEYRFLVRRPGESAFGELRPWGPDPRSAYLPYPFEQGRYEFQVQVRVAGNVSAYEATATASALLGQGCGGATLLVTDLGGGGMRLTASSSCGVFAPAEYRFQVKRPGDAAFVDLGPYGPTPEAYYQPYPFPRGRYEFQVLVRAAGNRSDYEAIARSSFLTQGTCSAADLTATPSADGIALSASASCAYGLPEYRFLAKGPGESAFTEIRPYGPDPQLAIWAKLPAGRHELQVQVRLQGNASDWEAIASATAFVGAVCSASGVTVSVPEGAGGIDVLGSSSCRLATPEYRFLARQPGGAAFREIRPWGPGPLAGFTPVVDGQWLSGRWELQVQVRAVGNGADDSSATASALVGSVCPGAALTATQQGSMQIDLSASASCKGTGRAQYRYLAKPPGASAFAEVKPWGDDVYAQIPARPGRWELQVLVRAAGNASDWEAAATVAVVVPAACTAASLGAVQDASAGVTLQAFATCSGNPEYRFLYRRAGAPAFAELRPYGPDPWASWDVRALPPGAWEVAVQARVIGNASVFDATAVVPVKIEAP